MKGGMEYAREEGGSAVKRNSGYERESLDGEEEVEKEEE